jgi:hypothetical protein
VNLRKDHSHASNTITVKLWREALRRDGLSLRIGSGVAGQDGCLDTSLPVSWHYYWFPPPRLSGHVFLLEWLATLLIIQLSATDVSARTTMKGAAKCDKHCELQNSVNQQELERTLRFRDTPESMPASASNSNTAGDAARTRGHVAVCSCAFGRLRAPDACSIARSLSSRATFQAFQTHCCCSVVVGSLSCSASGTTSRHEVRSANPLNLSI